MISLYKKDVKTAVMDKTFQLGKVFLSYNHEMRLLYNIAHTKIIHISN